MTNDSNQDTTTQQQLVQSQTHQTPQASQASGQPQSQSLSQPQPAAGQTAGQSDDVLGDLEQLIAQAQQRSDSAPSPEEKPANDADVAAQSGSATQEELDKIEQLKAQKEQETQQLLIQQKQQIQETVEQSPQMQEREKAKQEEAEITSQDNQAQTHEIKQLSRATINRPK